MKILRRVLSICLLILSTSATIGCSNANLNKAEEMVELKVANTIEDNLKDCENEGYRLGKNKIYYDILKNLDLSTISAEIIELDETYEISLIMHYKKSEITYENSYDEIIMHVDKNEDFNNIDLNSVEIMSVSSYINGDLSSKYVVKGYGDITKTDWDNNIFVEDKDIVKKVFLLDICDVNTLINDK